ALVGVADAAEIPCQSRPRTTLGESPMRRALKSTLIGGSLAILVSGGVAFATGGAGGMGGGGARPADMDRDLPGATGPRYDPAVEYAKAIAALKAQQYKAAVKAAEHVTDAAPKNPGGWQLL